MNHPRLYNPIGIGPLNKKLQEVSFIHLNHSDLQNVLDEIVRRHHVARRTWY